MKAFVLKGVHNLNINTEPLKLVSMPIPVPMDNEILIKISCCGVCHTELDEIEGRMLPSLPSIIPGHQVIGRIDSLGKLASRFKIGDRVGVAWIFSACGHCEFCTTGHENLCSEYKATGKDVNGGYAEYMTISEKFAYLIPDDFSDEEAAPLLCAGSIGYRSLNLSGVTNGQTIGLIGFGSCGHLVLKMAMYLFPDSKIYVFARSIREREFAISLGAFWSGDISGLSPCKVQVMIDTTPAWKPIIESLRYLKPGGRLVINAIRKEDVDKVTLLDVNYQNHMWMEKEIKSVANITRKDVEEFLNLAAIIPIKPEIETYPFEMANKAILDLKHKHVKGAKVLIVN